MITDDEAHTALADWAIDQGFLPGDDAVVVHPWKILDFSSVFSVERVAHDGARSGVFVKIPRVVVTRRAALPSCEEDREMARQELASLQYLARHWQAGRVRYVQPLGFCREHSAIVTRRAYGDDMFRTWRRHDLRRRRRPGRRDPMPEILSRLGAALRSYHDASVEQHRRPAVLSQPALTANKIYRSLDRLRACGAQLSDTSELVDGLLALVNDEVESPQAMTLKGLDLRNILLEEDGRLTLLDPGRLKVDDPVADLARLVATCRILYWGSPAFFMGFRPAAKYEQSLWDGYGRVAGPRRRLYDIYLMKELLKQWVAAYTTMRRKSWPGLFRQTIARTYVDPFYRGEIRRELARVAT